MYENVGGKIRQKTMVLLITAGHVQHVIHQMLQELFSANTVEIKDNYF